MNIKGIKALLCLAICIVFLSACSSHVSFRDDAPFYQRGMVEDLYEFPQDLTVYVKNAPEKLISEAAQQAQDKNYNRIYFHPWQMNKPSISPTDFQNLFGGPNGYNGTKPWTKTAWQSLKFNADMARYPNTTKAAITVHQTFLREMPTLLPRYSKPTSNPAKSPFDNFQYSALPPGMPLYITQISQDRQWYFAENLLAAGWVQAMHVAFVDEQFKKDYNNGIFAALISDNVKLKNSYGHELGLAYMGAIFPLVSSDNNGLSVLFPTRKDDGMAKISQIKLAHNDAAKKPLPLQAMRIAELGNKMMAQPYGWGGTKNYRDCSSTLHDLFTPFGIWLPRNSLNQYRSASTLPLNNLTLKPKEETILQKGVPFMTMIWLPGHIGLYLGGYKGRAAMFHNIWGIRVDEQGQDDDRHIIGRAVVTSLEPGKELENIYNNQTLLTRIGGISTLPGAIK